MAATKNSKEISVEEKLRALYDLQLIDSRLDEIQNTRGELPLEVEDLEDDIERLKTRIANLEEEVAEINGHINQRKELIKNSEALIKKYKKQQDNVRNNREFEALGKEIEYQELEIQLAEKHIKEFLSKIAYKEETKGEASEKLVSMEEHLKHKKGELDNLVKETQKEEDFLAKVSAEYAENIEERLLTAYKNIRSKVANGLAIVPVERGASAGSFFTIPPQRQVEIAQRKKIIIDEHSGRILVDLALANEEKEKMDRIFAENR